jgi:hypothetical protein
MEIHCRDVRTRVTMARLLLKMGQYPSKSEKLGVTDASGFRTKDAQVKKEEKHYA